MLSKLAWNAYIKVKGLRRQWRELDRFQSLDPALARQVMGRRLLEQLHYFAARGDALPEWREAASVRNPEDLWRIWPSLPLTFRKWRRRFPAIFCGWLVRGVGARPLGPSHLAPEVSLPRHAGWRGVWKPGPSVPVTPVNSSTRRAPCLNAPGSRPGHATSLRRPHSRHCRQLSPLTTRLPKNPLPPRSVRNVAPFGKRSDRTDPPRFYISQILCF